MALWRWECLRCLCKKSGAKSIMKCPKEVTAGQSAPRPINVVGLCPLLPKGNESVTRAVDATSLQHAMMGMGSCSCLVAVMMLNQNRKRGLTA